MDIKLKIVHTFFKLNLINNFIHICDVCKEIIYKHAIQKKRLVMSFSLVQSSQLIYLLKSIFDFLVSISVTVCHFLIIIVLVKITL